MKNQKYRVAIVGGAGTWGRHYLRAYAEHPDCQIVALVDQAHDRRQAFADRYGVEVIFDTVTDLLANDLPDIVSIILPVSHNPEAVIACAEAGVKAVSCEKPIAVTLSQADEMVSTCRDRGTAFGCGTGYWDGPYLPEIANWIQSGSIGRLIGAEIPAGLPREVSGGGCVQLTMVRLLTGMEVSWVEGWTLPPESGWMPTTEINNQEIDCPAYGQLGLSHDIVCQVSEPSKNDSCRVSIKGEDGQVQITSSGPVITQGNDASVVTPKFMDTPQPNVFISAIERLMLAIDTESEAMCSGHDYRQALEIAVALKQSAQANHQRIFLPVEDRSLGIIPHPYRLKGGDVAGWQSIGYTGPPQLD